MDQSWGPFNFAFHVNDSTGMQNTCEISTAYKCNNFYRGHWRFFNQSERDLLTKNFDFVVFKANEIQS